MRSYFSAGYRGNSSKERPQTFELSNCQKFLLSRSLTSVSINHKICAWPFSRDSMITCFASCKFSNKKRFCMGCFLVCEHVETASWASRTVGYKLDINIGTVFCLIVDKCHSMKRTLMLLTSIPFQIMINRGKL